MLRGGWILKSEPAEFSIRDLATQVIGRWDGVRNYQARNFMKEMTVGEKMFFYHSTCAEPGIYGSMIVHKASYPDPTARDPKSKYYDAKTTDEKNPWVALDVKIDQVYENPLLLSRIKELPLGECRLTAKGNRLSIIPITAEQKEILEAEIRKTNNLTEATSAPVDITRLETEELIRKPSESKKVKRQSSTESSSGKGKKKAKGVDAEGEDDDEEPAESDEDYEGPKRKKRKVATTKTSKGKKSSK